MLDLPSCIVDSQLHIHTHFLLRLSSSAHEKVMTFFNKMYKFHPKNKFSIDCLWIEFAFNHLLPNNQVPWDFGANWSLTDIWKEGVATVWIQRQEKMHSHLTVNDRCIDCKPRFKVQIGLVDVFQECISADTAVWCWSLAFVLCAWCSCWWFEFNDLFLGLTVLSLMNKVPVGPFKIGCNSYYKPEERSIFIYRHHIVCVQGITLHSNEWIPLVYYGILGTYQDCHSLQNMLKYYIDFLQDILLSWNDIRYNRKLGLVNYRKGFKITFKSGLHHLLVVSVQTTLAGWLVLWLLTV